MAQLRVTIPNELTLTFTCANYAQIRARAEQFVGAAKLNAKCHVSREGAKLAFCADEDMPSPVWNGRAWDTDCAAFFFDNADYNLYAEVEDGANLRIQSRFAADEGVKKFARIGKNGIARSGDINFGNDVGTFDFKVLYEKDGATRELTFTGEVLSQKLDARADWKVMIDDVERRYSMLAADFLRQTYHAFERKKGTWGDTPDLIWWNLFEALQEDFFKAVRTVLERPRRRLRGVTEYRRADQLRTLTPQLENAVYEHRLDAGRLYRVAYDTHSNDTPENRFIKHALEKTAHKYEKLSAFLEKSGEFGSRLSESEKTRFAAVRRKFRADLANPFFRGVGRFTGLRQMSLTLQAAPGYAAVARIFAILESSYMLFEGLKRLETKSIADLYEIWCFLKVEEIVKEICKRQFGDLFQGPKANHGELCGAFVKQLGTGTTSEVVFAIGEGNERVELAKVVYNPKITDEARRNNGLQNVIFPTALTEKKAQIPDIVLRLKRNTMNDEDPVELTYLFDAKYRIENAYDAETGGASYPPQDALDQMHRYRDAIYYAEKDSRESLRPADIKREAVGGYVLFPGIAQGGVRKPEAGDDNRPKYFKSIDRVNIGAIPLRPNNAKEYGQLTEFISGLIADNPTVESAMDRVNPQHGEILDDASQAGVADAVLCGTYRSGQKTWIEERGLYNLPKETAQMTGIYSKEDADRKRVLVLLSARGYLELSRPYKIVGCQEVTKDGLWHAHHYYKEPSDPGGKGYYLFSIKPLIESMEDVARRLKIVVVGTDGVSAGVKRSASEMGIEVEDIPDWRTAVRVADGVVVFDRSRVVPPVLKPIIDEAVKLRRSHQPLAMNMRVKKARKEMVRWLRILLGQVSTRKYVLFVVGREDAALESVSFDFFSGLAKEL